MPVADFSQGLELNIADFKEMIQQVAFAASTDDARPILTGVLVTVKGDQITMAARMVSACRAQGYHFLSCPSPDHHRHPARALSELARIAGMGTRL